MAAQAPSLDYDRLRDETAGTDEGVSVENLGFGRKLYMGVLEEMQ